MNGYEQCILWLLECPELQAVSDGSRSAIEEAKALPHGDGDDGFTEVQNTVVYLGEQAELIRTLLDQLCQESGGLTKAIGKVGSATAASAA